MTATHKVIRAEFWGKQVDHIDLGGDDVRIVLEDAIKQFCGNERLCNLTRDTHRTLEVVMSGAPSTPSNGESVCATGQQKTQIGHFDRFPRRCPKFGK